MPGPADENPDLDVTFEVGRIEEVIKSLTENDYDMVIGLSVFHHIVHEHGLAQVKQWIKRLADCTVILIMELALREEPLYWGLLYLKTPQSSLIYVLSIDKLASLKLTCRILIAQCTSSVIK